MDLILLDKDLGVMAGIDFKTEQDKITFAEVILYNWLGEMGIPVYIVRCRDWEGEAAFSNFHIQRYWGGDYAYPTPNVKLMTVATGLNRDGFEAWEKSVRARRKDAI